VARGARGSGMSPTRAQAAAVRKRWNAKPVGPHAVCSACDLCLVDVPWCPVEGHGERFVVKCWGFEYGEGSTRPPCVQCLYGAEFARSFTAHRRSPEQAARLEGFGR